MASEYVDDPEDDSFNDAIEEDDAGHISDDSFNEEETNEDDEGAATADAGKRKSSGGEPRAQQSRLQVTGAKVGGAYSASCLAHVLRRGDCNRSLSVRVHVRSSTHQGDYVILDENDLRLAMQSLTRDVATVLHVPDHLASMLLRTHNWNKEKFVTSYFEDPERLLVKNGLQFMEHDGVQGGCLVTETKDERDISQTSASQSRLPSASELDRSKTAPPNASHSYEPSTSVSASSSSTSAAASAAASSSVATPSFNCSVCYDDYALSATVALGCGDAHRFCKGCWGNYLTTAVNDGKQCIVTHCAGFKCPVLVPDKTFFNLTASVVLRLPQSQCEAAA